MVRIKVQSMHGKMIKVEFLRTLYCKEIEMVQRGISCVVMFLFETIIHSVYIYVQRCEWFYSKYNCHKL